MHYRCFNLFYLVTTVFGLGCYTGTDVIPGFNKPMKCNDATHCVAFFPADVNANFYFCDELNLQCGASGNGCSSSGGVVKKSCCSEDLCNTKALKTAPENGEKLECFGGDGESPTTKVTCNPNAKFCFSVKNNTDYYNCDNDNACKEDEQVVPFKYNSNGDEGKMYCCAGNLCNTNIPYYEKPVYPPLDCYTGTAYERTRCNNAGYCVRFYSVDNTTGADNFISFACDEENRFCSSVGDSYVDDSKTEKKYCCNSDICNSGMTFVAMSCVVALIVGYIL